MNIASTINVYAGGAGSGPSAPCPQCGPHGGNKNVEVGDLVRFKGPVSVDTQWGPQTYKKDTAAIVMHVLPKVGNADQMVAVRIAMAGAPDLLESHHMKMSDLYLDKKSDENVAPQAVSTVKKGQISIQFKTNDGAQVTWVKPHNISEPDPKSLQDISREEHYLKGKFAQIDVVKGKQGPGDVPGTSRTTRIYDTSGMPAPYQKGTGATIWVNSYNRGGAIKKVIVQEQNYSTYAFKTRGIMTFDYKNAADAVGMLKQRYGIKTTLERLRKNPK